jgi:hypothetical protein
MRNLAFPFIHFIAVLARLFGPGGVRSLIAESLLLKHQILILNRSRKRSPNLHVSDRILAGLLALLVRPTRLLRSVHFHSAMTAAMATRRAHQWNSTDPSAAIFHAGFQATSQANPSGSAK